MTETTNGFVPAERRFENARFEVKSLEPVNLGDSEEFQVADW